jgi:hypothetical protein
MNKNETIPKWVMGPIEEAMTYFATSFKQKESRFPGWKACFKRYTEKYDEIMSSSQTSVRALQEIHNELCIADALLEINNPHIDLIEYEPPLPSGGKTIDYKCKAGDVSVYIDVKTITPKAINAWDKFVDIRGRGLIAPNNEFILDPDYMGGEFWHDFFTSRGKMLVYSLELENKVSESGLGDEGNLFILALCGDGVKWHVDQLEDFVHFYRSGNHRYDDGFSVMENHFIKQKGIVFTRRIAKFIYLERSLGYLKPKRIIWNVTPPII